MSPPASHVGTDWQDQWARVQRWHNRVRAIAARGGEEQEWALDVVFAFFMNCYHFRDWLIDSGHSPKAVVDAHIAGSDALVWCRDICNGMKHYRLDPAKPTTTYQSWTTTAETKVYVSGSDEPERAEPVAGFYWSFIDPPSGAKRDMFELADDCVAAWASLLKRRHLAT